MGLWFRGFGFLRSWRILRFVFCFGFFFGGCFSMLEMVQLQLLFGGMCGGGGGGTVLVFAYALQAGLNLAVLPQPP